MIEKLLFGFGMLLLIGAPLSAHAVPSQPAPVEPVSPALQLARRVASMENSKDLPSRAVWLSKMAANSTNLAYQPKAPGKSAKKKSIKVED